MGGGVTVGYKMPLMLAIAVREIVAGQSLGALDGGGVLAQGLGGWLEGGGG